jgi:hypothetical protein
MELTLSSEETRELRDLLASALRELRSEIYHTDTPAFREQLHERERVLLRLQERLGPGDAGSAT